jgi:2-methylcitrate dehydratase
MSYAVDALADFVVAAEPAHLPDEALMLLRRNVLDSIGCAIAALDGETVRLVRDQVESVGGQPRASLIGGGRSSVDQAALFNSVAVRYVDLLDTYLTPGGLCHPADNFGAMLAVSESAGASGADFLLGLAVAYEVQSRFSASVPVMAHGLNHALQLAISVAAGAAKLLHLTAEQTANAIAIAAADNVSLAAIHSEPVSNWKGISPASPRSVPCIRPHWRSTASQDPAESLRAPTVLSGSSASPSICGSTTPPWVWSGRRT